jgi:hypothetical protein
VLAVGVLEEIIDAVLLHQPAAECQIGFAILYAIPDAVVVAFWFGGCQEATASRTVGGRATPAARRARLAANRGAERTTNPNCRRWV